MAMASAAYVKLKKLMREMYQEVYTKIIKLRQSDMFETVHINHAKTNSSFAGLRVGIRNLMYTNPKTRTRRIAVRKYSRPYVGIDATGKRTAFRSFEKPTKASHPEYEHVMGAFKTMKAAQLFAENTNVVTVAGAERIIARAS